MSAYSYPKTLHSRTQTPPQFGDYRKYKPYLQREFTRVCVYCRTPDTVGRSPVFHVEHYRPKSLFPHLVNIYSNLFYCCAQCNVRKGAYWPNVATTGAPVIPNPCDMVMFTHLRFVDGTVEGRTPVGTFAVEKLDLNEPDVVKFRQATFHAIRTTESQLAAISNKLKKLKKKALTGQISQVDFQRAESELIDMRSGLESNLQSWTGMVPLPSL